MKELSLHILDIIDNSLRAGANLIHLNIEEDFGLNRIRISIKDNGRGIPANLLSRAANPFFTTRATRRVGLGLSLFMKAAERCGGFFNIDSAEDKGTKVEAEFRMDHIDLAPMGDIRGTIKGLIMGNPDIDLVYSHQSGNRRFDLDTRAVRAEFGNAPFNHPLAMRYLFGVIDEGLDGLKKAGS
ncbi:MAG: ATP-binding protein [Deltaproteobacteria bacterium]|nr:ATP-binding protein [Deltaproteobacteria bacterium]